MKAILFVLVLVAFTASALKVHNQSKMTTFEAKARIQKIQDNSAYGSLILDAIQLHLELQGPVETILSLIDDIQSEVEQSQRDHDASWEATSAICDQRISDLQDTIVDANNQINEYTAIISDLNNQLDEANADLGNTQSKLDANQQQQQEEADKRAEEHADFLSKQQEHSEALQAIAEIIPVVQSLNDDYRTPVAATSFVQVQNKMKKATDTLMKIKKSKWQPLIQALAQLASNAKYFSDPAVVQKIVDLFNKLADSLQESLTDLSDNEDTRQSTYEQLAEFLRNEEADLSDHIDELRNTIESLGNSITYNEQQLADQQARLDDATATLEGTEAACAQAESWYNSQTSIRNNEISIIDDVRQIFLNLQSGASEFLTSRINAEVEA